VLLPFGNGTLCSKGRRKESWINEAEPREKKALATLKFHHIDARTIAMIANTVAT